MRLDSTEVCRRALGCECEGGNRHGRLGRGPTGAPAEPAGPGSPGRARGGAGGGGGSEAAEAAKPQSGALLRPLVLLSCAVLREQLPLELELGRYQAVEDVAQLWHRADGL